MSFSSRKLSMQLVLAALGGVFLISSSYAAEFTARFGSQDPPTTAKHAGLLKAASIVKKKTNGDVEPDQFCFIFGELDAGVVRWHAVFRELRGNAQVDFALLRLTRDDRVIAAEVAQGELLLVQT